LTRTVVVLSGGIGKRFHAYLKGVQKPFVQVHKKTQLYWATKGAYLSYYPDNFVFAARTELINRIEEEIATFNFLDKFEVVDVGESTLGPAHTLKLALDRSKLLLEDSEIIAVDNDCFNLLKKVLSAQSFPFVTITDSNNPQHCFVELMKNSMVSGFYEKDKRSSTAVSGNYGFINSIYLRESLTTLISLSSSDREPYLSDLMGKLVESQPVNAFEVTEYFSLGTPSEILLLGSELARYDED
jgi:NDP-sugar pyrophosphorylase family protein